MRPLQISPSIEILTPGYDHMYDESLATRVRLLLEPGTFTEIKMFGGLCVMVNGNMACGVIRDEMMVRVGPSNYENALSRPHARPMEFTGRPMVGMVSVGVEGLDDESLAGWVEMGAGFAGSLPPKVKKASKPRKAKKQPGA